MPTAAPDCAIRDNPEKRWLEVDLGDSGFAVA